MAFSDVSLTGHQPMLANGLATTADDGRRGDLQRPAGLAGIIIASGLPLRGSDGLHIGMVFLQPMQVVISAAVPGSRRGVLMFMVSLDLS